MMVLITTGCARRGEMMNGNVLKTNANADVNGRVSFTPNDINSALPESWKQIAHFKGTYPNFIGVGNYLGLNKDWPNEAKHANLSSPPH